MNITQWLSSITCRIRGHEWSPVIGFVPLRIHHYECLRCQRTQLPVDGMRELDAMAASLGLDPRILRWEPKLIASCDVRFKP